MNSTTQTHTRIIRMNARRSSSQGQEPDKRGPLKTFVFHNGRFAPQKPQTESVKRRNARERYRVRGINSCFEQLRACLPLSAVEWIDEQRKEDGSSLESRRNRSRLNKSRLLRYATAYIAYLSQLLKEPARQSSNDSKITNPPNAWNVQPSQISSTYHYAPQDFNNYHYPHYNCSSDFAPIFDKHHP
ncbi:hypothetical protein Ciccas_003612 [Cichlidogyrus casuarinus]|uniref:BHLH domain-containing protein n=1 Tax=Cichlidogyrus casuarinus TaxID=1844966 RepID=A0ABD2QE25_9PLAT